MTVCGPFINMKLLVELLPGLNPMSVYRYNTEKAQWRRLPPPDAVLAGDVNLWTVDTIMEWSDRVGMRLNRDTVEAAAEAQFSVPGA